MSEIEVGVAEPEQRWSMVEALHDKVGKLEKKVRALEARHRKTAQEIEDAHSESRRLKLCLEEIRGPRPFHGRWICRWCGGSNAAGHTDPCAGLLAEEALIEPMRGAYGRR